jgi:3-hydroxyacyl-[acyl-carrier-protein] dehydratase
MNQVGAILVVTATGKEGKAPYVVSIEKTRFLRPVCPGDQMEIEVRVVRLHKRYGKLRGEARVNGELAVEAQIMCTIPE